MDAEALQRENAELRQRIDRLEMERANLLRDSTERSLWAFGAIACCGLLAAALIWPAILQAIH